MSRDRIILGGAIAGAIGLAACCGIATTAASKLNPALQASAQDGPTEAPTASTPNRPMNQEVLAHRHRVYMEARQVGFEPSKGECIGATDENACLHGIFQEKMGEPDQPTPTPVKAEQTTPAEAAPQETEVEDTCDVSDELEELADQTCSVEDGAQSTDAPSAENAPSSNEAKPIDEAKLFSANQQGVYTLPDGTVLSGVFEGHPDQGTFIGNITSTRGGVLSGKAHYERSIERTWIIFATEVPTVAPYGTAIIKWPDGNTLELSFKEDGSGVDYAQEAIYTETEKKLTLYPYSDADSSSRNWFAFVEGRSPAESCTPIFKNYNLNPQDYSLKESDEPRDTTRTDCHSN